MEWIIVFSTLLLGLFLVLLEVFLIPGVTVAGVAGLGCEIASVSLSYSYFGTTIGNIFLIFTIVINLLTLYLAFRTRFWEKFALQKNLNEKVNEDNYNKMEVGMEGYTVSVLRPMGKAIVNGQKIEVSSSGEWIEKGSSIKIISIEGKKIIIEKSQN